MSNKSLRECAGCALGWSEHTKMWSFQKQQRPKVA